MKKAIGTLVCVLFTAAAAGPVLAGEEKAWFDLENCSFCRHLSAQPGLMENLGWEHFVTADGMLSVTTFRTEAARKGYEKAREAMQATGAKMMAGEAMPMCGFCTSMGGMAMAGARIEEFETEGGRVLLVSSVDPDMVDRIHAHAERTIEELATLMPAQ